MERRNFVTALTAFTAGIFTNNAKAQQGPTMRRINNTLYDILDSNTGESFTYDKVTTYQDGTAMTDGKVDGIIYRKLGAEYFKRNFTGPVNAKWFGATGNGITDDTAAIQAAIEYGKIKQVSIAIPNGTYLVTDTLTVYNGTIFRGEGSGQMIDSYSNLANATRFKFVPTVLKDFIQVAKYNTVAPFITHVSLSGFTVVCQNGLGRYGLKLDAVIYSTFESFNTIGFQIGIFCRQTINNSYKKLFLMDNSVSAVYYEQSSCTTDVWDYCTFYTSPIGVDMNQGIAIRFNNCLWEQIGNYGMQISKNSESIMVSDGYCEDVPNNNNVNGCMFRVGYTGDLFVVENHLIVIGGKYQGRNAGTVGSFLDVDYCNGIMLASLNVSRFTDIIKTSINTRANSVVVSGIAGITWTTFSNDPSKISGVYPNGVINSGSNNHAGRFASVVCSDFLTASYINTGLVVPPSSYFAANVDNAKSLGDSSLRWSVVYAGTGTINTSDANEKQQIEAISEAEHNAALVIKAGMRKFKFNDAVAAKGDAARIHFGAIAQDVKAAFEAQGLDPYHYGLFCQDTWTEKDGKLVENPTGEEGEVERTRLGIRYEELLSFIISAI